MSEQPFFEHLGRKHYISRHFTEPQTALEWVALDVWLAWRDWASAKMSAPRRTSIEARPLPRGYSLAQVAEARRWERSAAAEDWSETPGLFGAAMRQHTKGQP